MSLLKQAVPSISRVAVLWNPDYSDFKADWRELKSAVKLGSLTATPVGDDLLIEADVVREGREA